MTGMTLLLAAAIGAGTPLVFAILGEMITEKSGHLNLGVEGLMMMGAVSAFIAANASQNALVAVIAAMCAGIAGSLIYAVITVTFRAHQTVTGLALTIFGTGIAGFFGQKYSGIAIHDGVKNVFVSMPIPFLSKIPVVGEVFFNQNIFIYMGYVTAIVVGIYLYNTRMGLNLRTVGENTPAADASGINVTLYKYAHILIGGALCALGGAYLSLVYIPTWQDNVTAGRGWIAVALVIVSGWNPYKALGFGYLFGCLSILGFRLQKFNIPVSQYVLDMLPYIATVAVLIISSVRKGRTVKPPAWLGTPYYREDR